MTSLYWLVFFLILVIIEIATLALTTIWFAGGALAAFVLSLLGAGIEAQLAVFVAVSFVLLIFTRPWAAKYLNRRTVKTNTEGLIGQTARVTARIEYWQDTGTAMVNGQEWTARAEKETDVYPEGTLVVIRQIRGVRLIVSKNEEET